MTKNSNLVKGVVAVSMMMGMAACSTISNPPQDLVAKNDHAGLATFYAHEAADLRHRAEDMKMMVEAYQKHPEASVRGVMPPKLDLGFHCQFLQSTYSKEADEADMMARRERNLIGG
jgi:hypothetical protein